MSIKQVSVHPQINFEYWQIFNPETADSIDEPVKSRVDG